MTGLMERKCEGEINGVTEQNRLQGGKGAGKGHFATFPMVNDCLDKSVQIELTGTSTSKYPYSLILTTLK